MVLAIVPEAPPTWKNRRATSWPAPISANVPYLLASRLIWNAFLFVPTSISAFMSVQHCGHLRASQIVAPPSSLGDEQPSCLIILKADKTAVPPSKLQACAAFAIFA